MGRPSRTDLANSTHHVIARCDNRERWAHDAEDFEFLEKMLLRTAQRLGWTLLAYCFMSNHYHLIVRVPEDGHLSKGLHLLNRAFAGFFNKRYGRVGHVFEDRAITLLIVDDLYLVRAWRYVLRNPVQANLTNDPAAWRWSSAGAITGRTPIPPCVDWSAVARVLGGPNEVLPYLFRNDDDLLAFHELHQANARPPLDSLGVSVDVPDSIIRAFFLHRHSATDIAEYLNLSRSSIYRIVRAARPPAPET